MNEKEFEAIMMYVGIIGLFLMSSIAVVAAQLMSNPITAFLTSLLALAGCSLGFAFGSNGYNRRLWNMFNLVDSPSFDERKEALYGGDES